MHGSGLHNYNYFGHGWNMGLIIYVEKLMSLGWFQKCYPIVEELLKVVKTYLHNLHISNLTKLPVICGGIVSQRVLFGSSMLILWRWRSS